MSRIRNRAKSRMIKATKSTFIRQFGEKPVRWGQLGKLHNFRWASKKRHDGWSFMSWSTEVTLALAEQ